jgi:hypothetical protein
MNEVMKNFTQDLGFTVAFLVGGLIISLSFGNKVLYGYLILVLLSMSVVNGEKIAEYVRRLNA